MCAQRNKWSTLYGIGVQTAIETPVATSFGIPLLNQPSFDPGTQTINQRKATGTAYRQTGTGCLEYQQGASIPTTTFEFDANAKVLGYMLWSLFQTSSFEVESGAYPKYFVPYENSATEVWFTLVRKLSENADANSHRMVGAVVKSLTLSAEEGQCLKATVEFQGYGLIGDVPAVSVGHDPASDVFTFHTCTPLLWQNATVTLGGTTVNVDSFSITVTNNLVTKFYDSATAIRHDVNDLTVTGSIKIPWAATTVGGNAELDAFAAGTSTRLVVYWGTGGEIATTDGDFSIITHIRRTGIVVEGEDEISSTVNFEGASSIYSSTVTTASLSYIAINGTGAVTGTNTKFSTGFTDGVGFHKGDLLYPFGCADAGDQTVRIITAVTSDTAITAYPVFSGTENTKVYRVRSTPITFTLADGVNFPATM